ncbi:probable ubiquitin carboxyl-terminal hydrolase 3 [Trichoderma asperellum]|uniref:ubiquitinyl hydrolase 1 n=1 Tax=Trichoderma asperellum TaxID=101201 RepID=A0A6V8QWA0_TRIAP|nr:probable ubiquitin carboxyl-terminal hydrolase 3 [Trichoderma asperellum]
MRMLSRPHNQFLPSALERGLWEPAATLSQRALPNIAVRFYSPFLLLAPAWPQPRLLQASADTGILASTLSRSYHFSILDPPAFDPGGTIATVAGHATRLRISIRVAQLEPAISISSTPAQDCQPQLRHLPLPALSWRRKMSNRHLPAGQNIQAAAGGINGGMDMNGNMGHMGNMGGGPRRKQPQYNMPYHQHREHPHHYPHQQHPQHPQQMMYSNYAPYGHQQYYAMPPHQYQAGGVPAPGYMPYQGYTRSPPPMQQFAPMVGVSIPPSYPRGVPQSPNPTTPYQPPLAPAPGLPHTPSSTQSTQLLPPHTPTTPQTPQSVQPAPVVPTPPAQETALALSPAPAPVTAPVAAAEPREPFRPPLPWLSHPDVEFPVRTSRTKRQRKPLVAGDKAVSLPTGQHDAAGEQASQKPAPPAQNEPSTQAPAPKQEGEPSAEASGVSKSKETTKDSTSTSVSTTRPAAPAIPVVPVLPKHGPKPETASQEKANEDAVKPNDQDIVAANPDEASPDGTNDAPAPAVKAPPTSWANLFAKPSARAPVDGSGVNGANGVNGDSADTNNFPGSAFSKSNVNSLAEAIQSYAVENNGKLDFLEPRGLINTGNMCYMNSVLQVLMFCVPFYDLLDQVGKRAAHSFKSETPMIDALIMFMREYRVLKSSASVEQLNRNLKSEDLERYGEPFTPEFVYDAIRQLSRFDSMRRGHQQDAEEFLGFLLQSLDDECTHVMKDLSIAAEEVPSSNTSTGGSVAASDDWLEVGRKQRAAVSRLSGHNTSTPITKIFGGLLRSEFRVPGLKDSITTERYQPLQLDIQSPDVRNVVDALRGLTRPERIQGDFNSPRGKDVVATKQVFIESLPPVLILHLKRFQFDAEGHGTVKIWKKIGYPLELEIPREALSRQKRDSSMPRYKLISVVYHHGKNASGGHYTVDVRRQDGREWIRLDDTVIRRIRPEDVAETGSEEDHKDIRKEATSSVTNNRFGAMNDDDTGDEDGWKQVTAPANGKRWSSVVNGGANGAVKEKSVKDSIKDNKVAYLLFYQRI